MVYGPQRQPSRAQPLVLFYQFLIPGSLVHRDRDTVSWDVSKVFHLMDESWERLHAGDEKQEPERYVPSPHSPGLLSSFPSVSAVLWCTAAPHSPPATAWCVWSVWSGEERKKWGHTNESKLQFSSHLTVPLDSPQHLWQSQNINLADFFGLKWHITG